MESIQKGKKIIITMIVVLVLCSVITTAVCLYIYAASNDMERVISQSVRGTIRLSLECVIFYFLYKGREWAKNLTTILYLGGGILGFIKSISLLGINMFSIPIIGMSIIFVGFAFALITSKSVEAFLSYKRDGTDDSQAEND